MKTGHDNHSTEAPQQLPSSPIAAVCAALDVLTAATGNPTLHIQQARLFLYVAVHGEVLQADLDAIAGISQSSASRNVALLAQGMNPDEPGYCLLSSEELPYYRRSKVVRLTEKGKALAWDIQQAMLTQR